MNIYILINIVIAAYVGFKLYKGYKDGAILCLLKLGSFFIVAILAWILSPMVANLLYIIPKEFVLSQDNLFYVLIEGQINRMAWFVIFFIALYIGLRILRPFAKMMNKIPLVSIVNRLLGVCIAFLHAVFICTLITFLVQMPWFNNGNLYVENTLLQETIPIWDFVFEKVDFVKEASING